VPNSAEIAIDTSSAAARWICVVGANAAAPAASIAEPKAAKSPAAAATAFGPAITYDMAVLLGSH